MAHKVVPAKYYVWNFVALSILMTATVVVAKHPFFHASDNPNGWNLLFALGIAIAKATCIVAIFMGVAFSSNLVRAVAIAGFAWLLILFGFLLTDYVNPLQEFGTPYRDVENPGASPLPGGQDFANTGSEALAVRRGDEYVPPSGHGGGHGEDAGHAEAHQESSAH